MRTTVTPDQAKAGMVLASPVISDTGKVVLEEGVILTDSFIERLMLLGIKTVHIQLSETMPVKEQFTAFYEDTLGKIKEGFANISYFKEVPVVQMRELVDNAVNPMVDIPGAILYLNAIQQSDDCTFKHSLGVAVITGVFAKWAGYQGERLKDAILAGLLHDIGKLSIPAAILTKPGRLTDIEMAIVKKHPVEGYRLLTQAPTVTQEVLLGVLQHHERMDGSGYPNGLRGDQIHPYARILAVADLYDAVTNDRPFQQKMSPFGAARLIAGDMYDKFDTATSATFLEHLRDQLTGCQVKLSDGRMAEVILIGSDYTFHPVVKTQDGKFLDIGRNPNLKISQLAVTDSPQ